MMYECYSPCCKSTIHCILHVYNIKVTNVLLTVHDNTRTAHVTTASYHNQVSRIKLCDADNLILGEVKPDGIVHPDSGIGITNCTSVVGDNVGHAPVAESNLLHLEKLVCRLFSCDPVDNKAALNVVKQAEMITRLLDGEHICRWMSPLSVCARSKYRTHETSRIRVVSADLAVHLDETLLNN